jgi:hypothetical protein
MTEQETRLCGAYTPDPAEGFSVSRFLGNNIVDLFALMGMEGDDVQFLENETAYFNQEQRNGFIFDYVPVQNGSPLFGSEILEPGIKTTHFFIHRPQLMKAGLAQMKMSFDVMRPALFGCLWNFIGFNMRRMLQRRHEGLVRLSLSVLGEVGVDWTTQSATIQASATYVRMNGLVNDAMFRYLDGTFVGTDISSFVLSESAKGPLRLESIATRIARGTK